MRRVLSPLLAAALLASLPGELAADEVQKGRLRILRNGQALGSERYEIAGTGTEIQARGELEITVDNLTIRQSSSLLLGADLTPRRYEWKMEEPKKVWLRAEFKGSQATIWYPREDGKEEQQRFEFGAGPLAVLDINVFHHFLWLARLYDFSRGGPQSIQVFVPQSVQPGLATVELQEVETLSVAGQPRPVRRLRITTEDNQVLLWVTEDGRFVQLRAPLQNIEVLPESAAP